MCPGLASAFPDFKLNNIFTPEGEKRIEAVLRSEAGVASTIALLSEGEILQPNWRQVPYLQKYLSLVSNGGKDIRRPLLVIHGEADPQLSSKVTTDAVINTAAKFPGTQLKYALLRYVTHAPSVAASQRLWMDWIADRSAGRTVEFRCERCTLPLRQPKLPYPVDYHTA